MKDESPGRCAAAYWFVDGLPDVVIFRALVLTFNPNPPRPPAPLVLLALAVALYVLNRRLERPFRWWSALMLALTGLVFPWAGVPALPQATLAMMLIGGWLSAEGTCVFLRYLRANS